jgi:6-phosphogluconolactonase (cycloisomerase 2 family)
MRMGKWALLLLAMPLVTGCGDFWQAPSTTTTTTTTTDTSGYFYVLDKSAQEVIAYYVDAGVLTEVGAYAAPDAAANLTVAPNNKFLFVSAAEGVYVYTITSGALSTTSTQVTDDPAVAMAVDTNSSWLIETSGLGTLYSIPISSSTGQGDSSRTVKSATLTGSTVRQMVIAPSDGYVFLAMDTDGTVGFTFNSSTGSLGGSAFFAKTPAAGSAYSVAVDPSTRLLYIGETDAVSSSGGLFAYTIDSGTLTEISGGVIASGGTNPHAILPKSDGNTVYVANYDNASDGNITGFSVAASGSTYTLTKINTVATAVEPLALAEDSTEQFVIALNGGSPYLDIYVFDSTTATTLDLSLTGTTYPGTALGAQAY